MKKILIIFILLLVSGCSCKYELSINYSEVEEKLVINGVTTEIPIQADLKNFSTHEYDKKLNGEELTYQTTYSLSSFSKSDFLTCFDSYVFLEEEGTYTIRTGKKFTCLPYQYNDFDVLNYDNLEIVISTNNNVIEHNADKVESGKYYWNISKKNINNSEIYFKFSQKEKKDMNMLILIVFFGIVIVGAFIAYMIIGSKSNKSNAI